MTKIEKDKVSNTSVKTKQYVYIVQSSKENTKCKIGITNNLTRRLKEYNSMTGKSKENTYQYLFTCQVKNMAQVEASIKQEFSYLREEKSKEIYFFNIELFNKFVNFIRSNKLFIKEIFVKIEEKKQVVKIVKKTTPTLKERGITSKDVLQKAQKIENDEFYTRYEDIEKELSMYEKKIWRNKVVFCNCDDPVDNDERRTSAFSLYFINNFNALGLKKLICTHYSGVVDLFNQGAKGYVFRKEGYKEFKDYPEGYTGSFDDPLSLKILNEEAQIVCTNPPFSRSADYWKITIRSGKKFIIVSNVTNPVTPAFISYFKNCQVWAGYNRIDKFLNPKKELVEASGHWYTNFPIKNRPKYKNLKLIPLKKIPEDCKKYDDSNHLVVDDGYIPNDYKKPFAVSNRPILNGLLEKGYKIVQDTQYFPYENGKKKFARVLVQKL